MVSLINAIFGLLFSLFESIVSGISDIVVSSVKSNRREQYKADFIPATKILSVSGTGFCLTGDKNLSVKDSFSNAIVFGGSGAGKSSVILMPSIYRMNESSLIVHDPSGELFLQTSGFLSQNGFIVKVLNYANPVLSENYNPLERIKTISDIKKISNLLIHTSLGGGNNKDPFWNMAASNILTLFIRVTIFYTPKENHTLNNVLNLIDTFSGTPKKVDELFVSTKDDELLAAYKAVVAMEGKMLSSIVATAKTALSIFADPQVIKVTSKDSIDFESFRKEKTILYINNNVNDMKYYSVLSSIFFEQFFAFVMGKLPEKTDLPIFFLLDEASSLYLNILPVAISNIRKYNAGLLQIYQSQHQLFDLYGIPQARNIIANSYAKVYMPGQSLDVCRELELILGKFEYVDDENIKRTRQLLTMDEIRILKKEAIILCGNLPPIKAKLVPFYEQRNLKNLASLTPFILTEKYYKDKIEEVTQDSDEKQEA